MSQGHPRHQIREFTVSVRKSGSRAGRLHITAQTERDAILRAGLALARKHPGTDAGEWIVTGVHDPAPATWTPSEPAPRGSQRDLDTRSGPGLWTDAERAAGTADQER